MIRILHLHATLSSPMLYLYRSKTAAAYMKRALIRHLHQINHHAQTASPGLVLLSLPFSILLGVDALEDAPRPHSHGAERGRHTKNTGSALHVSCRRPKPPRSNCDGDERRAHNSASLHEQPIPPHAVVEKAINILRKPQYAITLHLKLSSPSRMTSTTHSTNHSVLLLSEQNFK